VCDNSHELCEAAANCKQAEMAPPLTRDSSPDMMEELWLKQENDLDQRTINDPVFVNSKVKTALWFLSLFCHRIFHFDVVARTGQEQRR
jgi:hypothetical protein